MTWSIIPLKDFHMFKIVDFFFFQQKLITDLVILNKWKSFNGMVDKWRDSPKDGIISRKIGPKSFIRFN